MPGPSIACCPQCSVATVSMKSLQAQSPSPDPLQHHGCQAGHQRGGVLLLGFLGFRLELHVVCMHTRVWRSGDDHGSTEPQMLISIEEWQVILLLLLNLPLPPPRKFRKAQCKTIGAGQCHKNVIFVNQDAMLRQFCWKSWWGIRVTFLKVESVNLYVESDWQSRTASPPQQRGLPELVFQLMGDMGAYENRLRITASACFRDVNKNLGLGLPSLWLTDFSIDLYLLANEIKVVKMITET